MRNRNSETMETQKRKGEGKKRRKEERRGKKRKRRGMNRERELAVNQTGFSNIFHKNQFDFVRGHASTF